MRTAQRIVFLFFVVLAMPALVLAQATITGTVKDASGAVLPGATVEVSSPALIERVRTAVTDGSGQYRVIDLRPGTYAVTFSLPGFSTVKREGIELSGSFVARIDGDLRVGTLAETITVTGETPIVDVQSVRRQSTISGDTIADLPTSRSYGALFALVPAVTTTAGAAQDVQVMPGLNVFGGAGGRSTEGRLQVEGLTVGAALSGGGVSSYVPDLGNSQEVTFTTSGGLGEAEVGGPTMNVVPKTGGNSVRGNVYAAGTGSALVGSNYSQELKDAGLSTPGDLLKLWDYTLGIGGPILKDRVWYYGNVRNEGSWRSVPGMYANKNAGNPAKFTYEPDLTRQAATAGSFMIVALRLTAQPTQKHKFNLFWDEQAPCQGAAATADADACRHSPDQWIIGGAPGVAGSAGVATATSSPEVAGYGGTGHAYQRVQQATWTSPLTNRLLAEAGLGTYISHYGGQEMPGNPTRDIPKLVEQCAPSCPNNGGIQNLSYGSQDWAHNKQLVMNWRASISFVSGSQSMKFGYQGLRHALDQHYYSNNTHLQYRLNNGVPNLLTMDLKPFEVSQRTRGDAFYAQEQWTLKRLTLQGAVRYDRAWSYFPEQVEGGVRFLPEVLVLPKQAGVRGYNDITPRAGLAYDVFGNSNTSIKINVGKYLEAATNHNTYTATNPAARIPGSAALGAPIVTRSWTDGNANYVPDCDLLNPNAQDNRASGGDLCGQLSNLNFGKPVFSTTFDDALLEGWGVRPSDWQFGASVQQKLFTGVSVEAGYFWRRLYGFTVNDNLAVIPADYGTYSITAPLDPRLPDGGGYTISGLYDVNPNKSGQVNTFTTDSKNFGDQYSHYDGLLVNVNARVRGGLTLQGGINSGRTVTDTCEQRAALPETATTNPYCHNNSGFVTRVTGLGAYTIPKILMLVSGTIRSDQGGSLSANYVVTSAVVAQSLGRPLSGNAPSVTINLLAPGTQYGDRINEVDLRLAKVLRFGRTRTNVGVDIYNLLNSAAVLTQNQAFNPGGRWLVPTSVLAARFAKFSASIDF